MTRIRPALTLALVGGLIACADDGVVPGPVVDRITVTPEAISVTTLSTAVAFEADARTAANLPVSGLRFEWTSSNPAVATIDADGTATTVGYGETTITVAADGAQARATLSVRDCDEQLALAPGEWRAMAVPDPGDCGVILPAGQPGDRYRVALVSADTEAQGGGGTTLDIRPLGVGAGEQPAPARRAGAPALPAVLAPRTAGVAFGLGPAIQVAEHTARVHERMRREEAQLLRELSPAAVLREGGAARAPALQGAPPPPTLMLDPRTEAGVCDVVADKVEAVLVYHDERLAFYQDAAQRQGGKAVTAAQLQRMADFYRDHGVEVIERYFGPVSDIDGNGRVIVFITPEVVFPTAAWVWSGDFFASEGSNSCLASNEAEMIYFGADIILRQDQGDWQSLETLVHEMKHVSSLFNSVQRARNMEGWSYHPPWFEEGTAEVAGYMASRRAWASIGGPAENAQIDALAIFLHGGEASSEFDGWAVPHPEFFGIGVKLFRLQGYLSSQPNSLVTTPAGASSDHTLYGAGWTFFRWLGDVYGNAATAPLADADLFHRLNAVEALPGIQGLEAEVGLPFAQLLERYAATIMLHGTPTAPPDLDFTSFDFPEAFQILIFGTDDSPDPGSQPGEGETWPWPVTTTSEGHPSWSMQQATVFQGPLGPAGLRIHDLVSDGSGVGAELLVTAPARTRIVVARVE